MTSRVAALLPLVVAVTFASRADASISVNPATSYNGSYTVSWTDASGGAVRAYLNESLNGGAWSKTTVTGTTSRAYSGKAVGTYSYKVQIYRYDSELKKELFEYETNVASVLVTVLAAPGVPGPITGPTTTNTIGAYSLAWTAASGTVTRYELQENAALAQSSTELSSSFSSKKGGTYTYRVRACNTAFCGNFTPELRVTVEQNLTTTLDNDTPVTPIPPTQGWVGAVPGTPSTDGGSAGYHIPIEVPPGRAGMQPSVALTYSSRSGNGIAGVGWSLSGLSSIYRCPRTLEQEGGNAPVRIGLEDRLCMDGKRLVQRLGDSATYGRVGSEYRTEVDDFARVRLKNADDTSVASFFDVEEKSGVTSRYAMKATTNQLTTWQLVAEFDRQNNCVSYEYQLFKERLGGDQEWVLSRISYTGTWSGLACTTGSDARSVEFLYTVGRSDSRTTYAAGTASMMTARLAAIVTKVGAEAIRRWELGYTKSAATQRSLLSSVKLCAGAGCLPPTVFTYQSQGAAPDFAPANPEEAQIRWPVGTPLAGTPLGPDWRSMVVGDYDGDGTRDRFVAQIPWANRTLLLSGCKQAVPLDDIYLGNEFRVGNGPGSDFEVDFDNDGRTDLIGWDAATGKLTIKSLKGCTWQQTIIDFVVGPSNPGTGSTAGALDYDGDGLPDIWFHDAVSGVTKLYRRTCNDRLDCFANVTWEVPTPPTPAAGTFPYVEHMRRDVNGDGRFDVFYDVELSGTGAVPQIKFQMEPGVFVNWGLDALGGPNDSFANSANGERRWLDVNGDGLPDIYDPRNARIYVNRGGTPRDGMFAAVSLLPPTNPVTTRGRTFLTFTLDVDADGQEEVMVPTVRTRDYCGGDPLRSQSNGDPY